MYIPTYLCKCYKILIRSIAELFSFAEPGLLEALKYRVEAAEQKFRAAELDDRLSEFEAARQRQVFIFHNLF